MNAGAGVVVALEDRHDLRGRVVVAGAAFAVALGGAQRNTQAFGKRRVLVKCPQGEVGSVSVDVAEALGDHQFLAHDGLATHAVGHQAVGLLRLAGLAHRVGEELQPHVEDGVADLAGFVILDQLLEVARGLDPGHIGFLVALIGHLGAEAGHARFAGSGL